VSMSHHAENDRHPPGGSIPLWLSGRRPSVFPALSEDEEADVCIVGAGISGLTLAYLLSATHRVIVLEKDFVGAGDTGRSTAHVTRVLDSDYGALAKRFGEKGAATAALAHGSAIDLIERIVTEESIACDFARVDGYVVGEPGGDEKLERMREAAGRAGIDDVTVEDEAPFETRRAAPCLRFPRQAQIDPWRYVNGLAEALKRRGGMIRTHTPVVHWTKGPNAVVETARGPLVRASAVVLATHVPLGGRPGMNARLEAYRTYVIAGVLPKDTAPAALAWDTASPYHYVRTAPRGEHDVFLIVGGEDHRTGAESESRERYARLESWARERFPSLGAIEHRWSGQVFETAGGLGFAGTASGEKGHELYATGHSGNGITHGTLAANLLSFLVREGDHDWMSVFDPGRVKLDDAVEVAKQGAATVAGLGERLKGKELESSDQVQPGHAALVGKGSSRLAVYREPDGKLWECSAVCSHMGCVVHWNDGESSWDCPCHGSRFDASGRVLEGPATKDLTPASQAHAR